MPLVTALSLAILAVSLTKEEPGMQSATLTHLTYTEQTKQGKGHQCLGQLPTTTLTPTQQGAKAASQEVVASKQVQPVPQAQTGDTLQ